MVGYTEHLSAPERLCLAVTPSCPPTCRHHTYNPPMPIANFPCMPLPLHKLPSTSARPKASQASPPSSSCTCCPRPAAISHVPPPLDPCTCSRASFSPTCPCFATPACRDCVDQSLPKPCAGEWHQPFDRVGQGALLASGCASVTRVPGKIPPSPDEPRRASPSERPLTKKGFFYQL